MKLHFVALLKEGFVVLWSLFFGQAWRSSLNLKRDGGGLISCLVGTHFWV
jgi:hypothetical protein